MSDKERSGYKAKPPDKAQIAAILRDLAVQVETREGSENLSLAALTAARTSLRLYLGIDS